MDLVNVPCWLNARYVVTLVMLCVNILLNAKKIAFYLLFIPLRSFNSFDLVVLHK